MSRRRPVIAGLALVLGLLLIVGALLALHGNRHTPRAFGGATAPASTSAPRPSLSPTAATSPSGNPPSSTVSRTTPPSEPVAQVLPLPAQLNLPTLDVQAPVTEVETADGVLGVPDDPATVGWWTGSAAPGSSSGSTVIDGHVDSAVTGLGALFHLSDLAQNDVVSITTTAGNVLRYRVYGRQIYVKHEGLPASLFAAGGPARLILITCGGPFDHTTRNYLDNVVVFASPIAG